MPTVKLAFRRRGIRRERPRPNAAGHYITAKKFNQVYFLVFPRTDKHYVQWDAYQHPYPHPVGYVFPPPPTYAWQLLGPVSDPETVNTIETPPPYQPVPPPSAPSPPPAYPSIPVPPPPLPPILPPGLPPGTTPTKPVASSRLFTATITVTTSATKLQPARWPNTICTILANPDNTARVWVQHSAGMAAGQGFPLSAGAAIDLTIDDLAKVYLTAESGTQTVHIVSES
ncbi:MAG: hypothetical protein QXE52_08255 [Candidatus Caldarchaeum sp.]